MAWTIATTAEQADSTARRTHPALRLACIAAIVVLLVLTGLGRPWALPAALVLLGARLCALP